MFIWGFTQVLGCDLLRTDPMSLCMCCSLQRAWSFLLPHITSNALWCGIIPGNAWGTKVHYAVIVSTNALVTWADVCCSGGAGGLWCQIWGSQWQTLLLISSWPYFCRCSQVLWLQKLHGAVHSHRGDVEGIHSQQAAAQFQWYFWILRGKKPIKVLQGTKVLWKCCTGSPLTCGKLLAMIHWWWEQSTWKPITEVQPWGWAYTPDYHQSYN